MFFSTAEAEAREAEERERTLEVSRQTDEMVAAERDDRDARVAALEKQLEEMRARSAESCSCQMSDDMKREESHIDPLRQSFFVKPLLSNSRNPHRGCLHRLRTRVTLRWCWFVELCVAGGGGLTVLRCWDVACVGDGWNEARGGEK